jgi:hypothetical protein
MNEGRRLDELNWVSLMAVQALTGLISSNFRQVVLCRGDDAWVLKITLRKSDSNDDDAAADIADDLAVYLDDVRKDFPGIPMEVKVSIDVTAGSLPAEFSEEESVLLRVRDCA